jgi:hypothetical protein
MVGHLALGVHHPVEAPTYLREDRIERLAILIPEIDCFLPVPTGGHVVESTCEFNAKRTGHDLKCISGKAKYKT